MRTTRPLRALAAVALLAAAASPRLSAHHAVLRFNLEEMTVAADRIFLGVCTGVVEAEEEISQGLLPVTRYSFAVESVLKGNVPERFTYTQIGHPPIAKPRAGTVTMHGRGLARGFSLHGASEFAAGDRVLLFLIPSYNEGRLTYPVGLDQGAFLVTGADGDRRARNNLNNMGLFTAPYNGTRMRPGEERVLRPDDGDPLGAAAGLSPAARALPDGRGAIPLAPLVELVRAIDAAHRPGAPSPDVR